MTGMRPSRCDRTRSLLSQRLDADVSDVERRAITRHLARSLGGATPSQGIIITALSPGLCDTELFRNAPWIVQAILAGFMKLVGRSAEMGARATVAAAVAGPEMHGVFMQHCQAGEFPKIMDGLEGEKLEEKVWGEMMEILEGIRPGVTERVRALETD